MTPDEIVLKSRQRYNAVGDTFFAADEMYDLIWQAEQEMSIECQCIEDVQTTSTVISQREYAKPTNAISIKRVTWNGMALIPIDFMDDDAITGFSEATTDTGTPTYYSEWEDSIFLRPIPNAVQTLKVYFFARPQEVTTSTVLEIREEYQMMMVDYLLQHMFGKDGKNDMSQFHLAKWEQSKAKVRGWEMKRKRGNAAAAVKNLDAFSELSTIV
jgi:hypothetical protein